LILDATPTTTDSRCLQERSKPKASFAMKIDGRLKTEFATKEGAELGSIELKRRFPMLQPALTRDTNCRPWLRHRPAVIRL
jgi:hypothetical protein